MSVFFRAYATLDSEILEIGEGDNLIFVFYMYLQLYMIHLCFSCTENILCSLEIVVCCCEKVWLATLSEYHTEFQGMLYKLLTIYCQYGKLRRDSDAFLLCFNYVLVNR